MCTCTAHVRQNVTFALHQALSGTASEETLMGDRVHNWLTQFQSENRNLKSQVTHKHIQYTHAYTYADTHTTYTYNSAYEVMVLFLVT